MRAVRAQQAGRPEVLQLIDVAKPSPARGEVLIKIKAAGVNYADIGMRSGLYARSFPTPLGLEAAGVIEDVGEQVSASRIGEHVLAYSLVGAYAEYAVTSADLAFRYPASLAAEAAACTGVTYMTAYHCLVTHGHTKSGDWLLIHAAGSGTGVAATQIARHLGAHIIATVGSDEKLAKAKAQGAHEVFNYHDQDFVVETLRITGGRGVDIVLDGIGGDTLRKSIDCLAPNGRVVNYGKTSQNETTIDPISLWSKNLTIKGVSVQQNSRDELRDVLSLIEAGVLTPVIDRVYPLEDAATAHRYLAGRRSFGKVVLRT
jgi:NADPH2:quinone reductase